MYSSRSARGTLCSNWPHAERGVRSVRAPYASTKTRSGANHNQQPRKGRTMKPYARLLSIAATVTLAFLQLFATGTARLYGRRATTSRSGRAVSAERRFASSSTNVPTGSAMPSSASGPCGGRSRCPMQGDWYARHLCTRTGSSRSTSTTSRTTGIRRSSASRTSSRSGRRRTWDPDRLMALYKKAGAKYFCMIAEHHDNFDCWNSKFQTLELRQHGAQARHRRRVAEGRAETRPAVRHDRTPGGKLVVLQCGQGRRQERPPGRRPLRRRRPALCGSVLERQRTAHGELLLPPRRRPPSSRRGSTGSRT